MNGLDLAKKVIEGKKHVFIEKPITQTLEQADKLLKIAKQKNVLIQVGHIERLNPALTALKPFSFKILNLKTQAKPVAIIPK